MITWIRENAVLFSIVGTGVICISTVAVARFQLAALVASQAEVRQHMNDTTRHLDPQRDGEATRELKDRIDKLERQIERLERRQIWIVNSVRQGSTSPIPMFLTPPPN